MTSSYLIELKGNTLSVGFNGDRNVPGDRCLLDARSQLQSLISSGQITGGSLLKIDGRASLAIGYFLAHELSHLYQVIAVCDPRLHGDGFNRYVVVISYVAEYSEGDLIECSDAGVEIIETVTANSKENSTFFASVEGDILKVFYLKAPGNQIAVDAAARIDELIAEGQLKGGKLIKINGKATLFTSYIIAHRLAHLYSATAVFDPKICEAGIDKYIVALSHGFDKPVGAVLEYVVPAKTTAKVALCGYPGAGKTCLREGLKYAIKNNTAIADDFCYVISACPDGDTAYFLETAQKYPDVAKELRQRIKQGFTERFATAKAREIRNIPNDLLIFDVGGKISPHNWTIMSEATHAIILAKQEELSAEKLVQPWQEFCQDLGIPVVAIIYSDYHGKVDTIIQQDENILIGTVHHLDRQVDTSSRPTIKKLADLLVGLNC